METERKFPEEKTNAARRRTVVGIPAYNEEVSIGSVVVLADEYADEVVVVNDGSTDLTPDIVARTPAKLIEHRENRGKGHAVRTILEYCRSAEEPTELVLLDGDGQHRPKDIPRLLDGLRDGDADVVLGSRYLGRDGSDRTPVYRRIGQKLLDEMMNYMLGRRLSDTQSGFVALSPASIDELTVERSGMDISAELILKSVENGFTIREVPINVRYRGTGKPSRNPLSHGYRVVSYLFANLTTDR